MECVCQTCHSVFPEDLATDCGPGWNSKAWTVACHPLPGLGAQERRDISWVFHGALLGSRTLLGHLEFRFFFPHCWNRINKCTPGQPSSVSFSERVICRAEMYSAGVTLVYEWPGHWNPSHGMLFLTAMETETHRGGANAFVSLLSAWLEHFSPFHVILGIKSILWKLTGAVLLNLCSSRFYLIVDNYYCWVRQ